MGMPILVLLTEYLTVLPLVVGLTILAVAEICVCLTQL